MASKTKPATAARRAAVKSAKAAPKPPAKTKSAGTKTPRPAAARKRG